MMRLRTYLEHRHSYKCSPAGKCFRYYTGGGSSPLRVQDGISIQLGHWSRAQRSGPTNHNTVSNNGSYDIQCTNRERARNLQVQHGSLLQSPQQWLLKKQSAVRSPLLEPKCPNSRILYDAPCLCDTVISVTKLQPAQQDWAISHCLFSIHCYECQSTSSDVQSAILNCWVDAYREKWDHSQVPLKGRIKTVKIHTKIDNE